MENYNSTIIARIIVLPCKQLLSHDNIIKTDIKFWYMNKIFKKIQSNGGLKRKLEQKLKKSNKRCSITIKHTMYLCGLTNRNSMSFIILY